MRGTGNQAGRQAAPRASLSDVISVVASSSVNLKQLAVLGACSNVFKDAVRHALLQSHDRLLMEWLQHGNSFEYWYDSGIQRWSQGLQWLLKAADGIQTRTAGHVLALQHPKRHIIDKLLYHGFRPTYQQLAEAARQRTVGVEYWIHNMVARGMELPSGMPKVALEVICSGCQGYKSQGLQFIIEALDPNNLADILHLAINRKYRLRDCSFEPQEILGHILQPINSAGHQALQEQMTPQLLSELMQTAIDHSHHAVVSSLCRFPAVNSLDAVTVQQMFLQVMRQHAERDFTYILGDMFTHLAAYLDSTTADELLLLAAQTKKASAMGWFAKLDVAKLISSRAIDAVVKTLSSVLMAVHNATWAMAVLEATCKTPAVHGLNSTVMTECLAALIMTEDKGSSSIKAISAVAQLSVVQSLTAPALQGLLETAVAYRNQAPAVVLLTLPAAAQLRPSFVLELLQQAIMLYSAFHQVDVRLLAALLNLPVIARLSASEAAGIVQYAIVEYKDKLLPLLLSKLVSLDAAGVMQLSTAAASRAASLLDGEYKEDQEACSDGGTYDDEEAYDIIELLLETSAARQLSVQHIQQLLPLVRHAALGHHRLVKKVCNLPAMRQLTAEEMHQMLRFLTKARCQHFACLLLELSAAQYVSAASIGALLLDSVQQGMSHVVISLCSLSAAEQVQMNVLLEAVLAGMERRLKMTALKNLCALLLDNISSSFNSSDDAEQPLETPSFVQQSDADAAMSGAAAQQPSAAQTGTKISRHSGQQCQQPRSTHSPAAWQDKIKPLAVLDRVLDAAILHECLPAIESWVCNPPVVALFTSSRVVQLMDSAVAQHSWKVTQLLCDLPAAAEVPLALAEHMLLAAAQNDCSATVAKLCGLPAVKQIGLEAALRLVNQARTSACEAALFLCSMPALMDMGTDDVFKLMKADMQLGDGSKVLQYLSVPAVQDIDVSQVTELLRTAISSSHWLLVEALCTKVPAAKAVDAGAVEALMRHCILYHRKSVSRWPQHVHGDVDAGVAALFQLPGFAQMSPAAVKALRAAAASHMSAVMLAQLAAVELQQQA